MRYILKLQQSIEPLVYLLRMKTKTK